MVYYYKDLSQTLCKYYYDWISNLALSILYACRWDILILYVILLSPDWVYLHDDTGLRDQPPQRTARRSHGEEEEMYMYPFMPSILIKRNLVKAWC